MKIHFTDEGWQGYQHWVRHDRTMQERVNSLIEAAGRNLSKGLGKP